jgi:hypothetical protein
MAGTVTVMIALYMILTDFAKVQEQNVDEMVEEKSAIAVETEDRSDGNTLKDKDVEEHDETTVDDSNVLSDILESILDAVIDGDIAKDREGIVVELGHESSDESLTHVDILDAVIDGDIAKDREGIVVELDHESSDESLTHVDASSDTKMDTERTIPSQQEDNIADNDIAMRTGDGSQTVDNDADQSSAVDGEAAAMVESKRAVELNDNTLVFLRHTPPTIPVHTRKEFFGQSKIKIEDFNGIPDRNLPVCTVDESTMRLHEKVVKARKGKNFWREQMATEPFLEGWVMHYHKRPASTHVDRYFFNPNGKKFRSRPEVLRFLEHERDEDSAYKAARGRR